MASSIWPSVRLERTALADDLKSLDTERWATGSLCAGWSVRDALAHMTATAKMTPPKFIGKMLGSGFSFQTMTRKGVASELGGSPADTLANFVAAIPSTNHPPGPGDTWLAEVVIHAEDIRRPLGITHVYDTAAVTRVADFVRVTNPLLGGKRRAAGLKLQATDVEWSAGDGPEVSGPIIDIILAVTGRRAGLATLSGDGVKELTARM